MYSISPPQHLYIIPYHIIICIWFLCVQWMLFQTLMKKSWFALRRSFCRTSLSWNTDRSSILCCRRVSSNIHTSVSHTKWSIVRIFPRVTYSFLNLCSSGVEVELCRSNPVHWPAVPGSPTATPIPDPSRAKQRHHPWWYVWLGDMCMHDSGYILAWC